MANLLDKASILLTPTAYNNGSMLSIKPTDGDGDFTFSRNSAATRVNAQGLVENVQILSGDLVQNGSFSEIGAEQVSNGSFSQEGAELITNGDFATDSNWNQVGSNGWSIDTGTSTLNFTNASSYVFQGISTVSGKSYKVTLDIELDSGTIVAKSFSAQNIITVTSTGRQTVTGYFKEADNNANFGFVASDSASGKIHNVSVKEVGQDWTIEDTWTISDGVANGNGANGSEEELTQSFSIVSGKTYKVVYDVLNYVSGTVRFQFSVGGTVSGTTRSSNGTFTEYVVASGNHTTFKFRPNNFNGSITNISVKEVGQNWSFGDGFTPDQANSKATCDGTQSAATNLTQTISTNIQNKLVRVSFTLDYTAGVLLGSLSGTGAVDFNNITSSGTYTAEMTSNEVNPPLILQGDTNFIGSITNIVLLEITNDTNLPRINYEGFSYQDVLGSEQIVNGTFNDGSNWTTLGGWSIGGGSANCNGGSIMYTNGSIEVSKTYKVTYDIINYVSGNVRSIFNGTTTDGNGTTRNANGTFTELVQSTDNASGTFSFGAVAGSFIGSIDNVSVKEYLGQEVVPDSGCGSWLLEDESTNLILNSENLSDSSWQKSNSTIVSNSAISPSGYLNSDLLQENSSNSTHYCREILTVTSGVEYTLSFFAKKKDNDYIQYSRTVDGSSYANFNIANGTLGNNSGGDILNHQIEDYGNGWYRCIANITTSSTSTGLGITLLQSDVTSRYESYLGDGTSGTYIWGAQLEQQSYATSYIPTFNAPNGTSRNRDIATDSGNATLINSTEGVLYAEIAALANDNTYRILSLSDGTDAERIYIQYTSTTNQVSAVVKTGSSTQANIQHTLTDETVFSKIAFKWKANDFAFWIDGVEVGTDTSGSVPSGLNRLALDRLLNTNPFFGKAKALAVYKEALTDAELQSLTTI